MFVILAGYCSALRAQDVLAAAKVDSNNIRIGDQLKLHLEVKHPANVSVLWPSISDSLQGIEIVSRDTVHAVRSGNDVTESSTLTITSFDSGTVIVPPLPFEYAAKGDTLRSEEHTSELQSQR